MSGLGQALCECGEWTPIAGDGTYRCSCGRAGAIPDPDPHDARAERHLSAPSHETDPYEQRNENRRRKEIG